MIYELVQSQKPQEKKRGFGILQSGQIHGGIWHGQITPEFIVQIMLIKISAVHGRYTMMIKTENTSKLR